MWQVVTERVERWRREHESKGSERRNAEKEVVKLEAEIGRLVGALAAGTGSADITAAITERRSKVETLKAKNEPDDIDLDRDYLVKNLNVIFNGTSYTARDADVKSYIDTVTGPLGNGSCPARC